MEKNKERKYDNFIIVFLSLFLLLHVLEISPSDISCVLADIDEIGKNMIITIPKNNIILKSIIQNEKLDKDFESGGYPLNMSLSQWETLNHCYAENDLRKISADEIIQAIIVANKIDTTKPIEEAEKSVMDVLMTKAKKIVTVYDFSNVDQNYIHQRKELRELFNSIYFDTIKEDVEKNKKIINKFSNFDYWYNALENDHLEKQWLMCEKLIALLLFEFCVWIPFAFYFDYIKSSFGSYWWQKIWRGSLNITATLLFYNFFMIFYKTATQGLLQLKKINFKEKQELYRFYQQSKSIVCEEVDINSKGVLKTWKIDKKDNKDNKEDWILRKYNEFVNVLRYNPENNESKYCTFDMKNNACINTPKDFSVTHSIGSNYYILSQIDHSYSKQSKICDVPFLIAEGVNWANDIYIGALENNTISDIQKICEITGDFLFLNNQCTIRLNNNCDTKEEYITFYLPSDFNNFLHQKHEQIITYILSLSFKAVFLMYVSYVLAKGNLCGELNFFNPFDFDSFEKYDLIRKRKKYMPFILKLFNTIITYQENFFTYQLLKHFSKKMLLQSFFAIK